MLATIVVKKTSPLVRVYLLAPIIKLLLAFCVMTLCIVAGMLILHAQSSRDMSRLASQKQSLEVEVSAQAKEYGELSYLPKTIVDAKKRYETILKTFPPSSKAGELLTAITQLGTREGLKFVYFKPEKANTFEYYAAMPIDIAVVGHFHQIGKFLDGVANLPESVVAVNTFVLERDTKNPNEGLLSFQFKTTLYYAVPASTDIVS